MTTYDSTLAGLRAPQTAANDDGLRPTAPRRYMCGDPGCDACNERELHAWERNDFTPETAALELRRRFPRAAQ